MNKIFKPFEGKCCIKLKESWFILIYKDDISCADLCS